MLDPQLLRHDLETVQAGLGRRGFEFDATRLASLEQQRKQLQTETETLQADRNRSSKAIGKAKQQGEDIEPLLAAVADLGDKLKENQSALDQVLGDIELFALGLPNLPHEDVPAGADEDSNLEMRRWGHIFVREVR